MVSQFSNRFSFLQQVIKIFNVKKFHRTVEATEHPNATIENAFSLRKYFFFRSPYFCVLSLRALCRCKVSIESRRKFDDIRPLARENLLVKTYRNPLTNLLGVNPLYSPIVIRISEKIRQFNSDPSIIRRNFNP